MKLDIQELVTFCISGFACNVHELAASSIRLVFGILVGVCLVYARCFCPEGHYHGFILQENS